MFKMYQEMPLPFNYFADVNENPVQTYYFPVNSQQRHVSQYVLPYAGVDLRCLPWSKVIEILEKQAETYKLFQLNAAYGFHWANEQNFRVILEFNEMFRKEVELLSDERSEEGLSVFKIPTVEVVEPVKETPPVPPVAPPLEGSKKRKRASKKSTPKKLKKGKNEEENFRYSPVVSPISPSMSFVGQN